MCAQDDRDCVWLRPRARAPKEREWPRLVMWDFLGACALLALVGALIGLATGT